MDLPNAFVWAGERRQTITGMGVPRGVTLIVGGGYHGKSTLLAGLERGVYPHIPGDGREYVVADPDLVKIRSEDGRSVTAVDIRPFIGSLPSGRDTRSFSSDNASGSTSQAANIVEALEVGASGLLLDEDTCATNFMVRDARMQALVAKEHEPITPFLDQIEALYRDRGVSTVLVMGGSGDYFEVADVVVMMRDYQPVDVTAEAKRIATEQQSTRQRETGGDIGRLRERGPDAGSLDPRATSRKGKVRVRGAEQIQYGHSDLDLRYLEQLVDRSQTAAVADALELLGKKLAKDSLTLRELMDDLDARFDREGVETVSPFQGQHPGNLARPRRFEVAAALNRLRVLRVTQKED
ncbi:MAG: ABC-ATPase domain-containing protein [Trueperaceae bacterium]|nr:ABC-ATPase domain-containing protein [Trueperaceae bacterium]